MVNGKSRVEMVLATGLWLIAVGIGPIAARNPIAESVTPGGPAASSIRGDANNDGEITLADAIHVTMYLYAHGPTPQPALDSGDANCDSKVDPLDIIYLVNYTLRGGPKPKCTT
jgi:hypothetical protein